MNLEDALLDTMDWQRQTFPTGTLQGVAAHLHREIDELVQAEQPIEVFEELADCLMLLAGLIDKKGIPIENWPDAIMGKLKINRTRTWVKNEQGFSEHKR